MYYGPTTSLLSQHIRMLLFTLYLKFQVVESRLGFCTANSSIPRVRQLSDVKDKFIQKSIWRKKQESNDTLSYMSEKWQLFDHIIGGVCDILLIFCMETWELSFSGYSVWWSRESLNLVLLSWRTLLGAKRSRNWLFPSSSLKLWAPSTGSVFDSY